MTTETKNTQFPLVPELSFSNGRWRPEKDTAILLPKGTIVDLGHVHLYVTHNVTLWNYVCDELQYSDMIDEKECPHIVFHDPKMVLLPHNPRVDCFMVEVHDWLLKEQAFLAGARVPLRVLENTSAAMNAEVERVRGIPFKGAEVRIRDDLSSKAGTFIAAALQGRWSLTMLDWKDRVDVAIMVYGYEMESLYDEVRVLLTHGDRTLAMAKQLFDLESVSPKFQEVARTISLNCITKASDKDLQVTVAACVAAEETRGTKRQKTHSTSD